MKQFIHLAWQDYSGQCVPAGPGSTQYDETKKAFFGGAMVVMAMLQEAGKPGVSEDAAVALMMLIEAELEEFKSTHDAIAADKFKRRNRPSNN